MPEAWPFKLVSAVIYVVSRRGSKSRHQVTHVALVVVIWAGSKRVVPTKPLNTMEEFPSATMVPKILILLLLTGQLFDFSSFLSFISTKSFFSRCSWHSQRFTFSAIAKYCGFNKATSAKRRSVFQDGVSSIQLWSDAFAAKKSTTERSIRVSEFLIIVQLCKYWPADAVTDNFAMYINAWLRCSHLLIIFGNRFCLTCQIFERSWMLLLWRPVNCSRYVPAKGLAEETVKHVFGIDASKYYCVLPIFLW